MSTTNRKRTKPPIRTIFEYHEDPHGTTTIVCNACFTTLPLPDRVVEILGRQVRKAIDRIIYDFEKGYRE